MSEPELVRWSDASRVPWKNGAGMTRELISSPRTDPFDWRISIADVAVSAEFSTFPDVERTIVLLEGADMTLTVGGVPHQLVRFEPFVFDGDLATSCAVTRGPTRDLNVMTRRDRCRALVDVIEVDASATRQLAGDGDKFVIALQGQITVLVEGSGSLLLDQFDLLRLPDAVTLELRGTGPVACIEVR